MEKKVWLHWFPVAVLIASGCGSAAQAGSVGPTSPAAAQAATGTRVGNDALAPEAAVAAVQVVDRNGHAPVYDAFAQADDVYLTGTLPDGDYYYQITDRSCSELLAGPSAAGDVPDTTYRRLHVAGGKLAPVSIAPFVTEAKDGQGAYRVHVVPVSGYAFAGPGCYGFAAGVVTADFALSVGPATDPSYCVSGAVYVERSPVDGVQVELVTAEGSTPVAASSTDMNGRYSICGLNPDRAYVLTAQAPDGLAVTQPAEGRFPVANYTGEDLDVQPFYLN